MNIQITQNPHPAQKPDSTKLGFGNYFTDHMFMMDYEKGVGWHDARIVPFGPMEMHPASVVFHYGAEIFEGMKAYRRPDGTVQLFRPIENVRRMNNSAERLCLPQMDESEMLQAIETFVQTEQDWVPSEPGTSLYIRPFMFGNDETLGVHAVHHATFIVICCPVGSYYKEGINPVGIMIEDSDVRAVRGGTGYAKCGGNYAASNRAGERAEKKGYSQVLWLDSQERKYVEEVGAMNIFFKIDGKVYTANAEEQDGTVLPGVTRRSIIELLRDWGYEVVEGKLAIDTVMAAAKEGKLEEVFGSGTAAVVSPVKQLDYEDQSAFINNGEIGPLTQKLYDTMTGMQWGKLPDTKGWILPVCQG